MKLNRERIAAAMNRVAAACKRIGDTLDHSDGEETTDVVRVVTKDTPVELMRAAYELESSSEEGGEGVMN